MGNPLKAILGQEHCAKVAGELCRQGIGFSFSKSMVGDFGIELEHPEQSDKLNSLIKLMRPGRQMPPGLNINTGNFGIYWKCHHCMEISKGEWGDRDPLVTAAWKHFEDKHGQGYKNI